MNKNVALPKQSDFPKGTEFYIYEWDVPISKEPNEDGKTVSYYNWLGGSKRTFPIESLKIDNNWPADSFEEWINLIRESI